METQDVVGCTALLATLVRGEGIAEHAQAYGGAGEDASIENALRLLTNRSTLGFVWLTEEAGAIVAVATVCFMVSTNIGAIVARVPDLVVAEKARGRGVGAFAIASLAAELRAIGVRRLDLGVHDNNPRARHFYERLGFVTNHETGMALVL
jgi:ribosomal protein S18 acetylase RimI-like enzyme